MRVQVHAADFGGCGYYRLRWAAHHLDQEGHDVGLYASLPGQFDRHTHQLIGCDTVDADVVVLQRPARWELPDLIPHVQAQGVAVVVEIDDDFSCIPPANPAWKAFHPQHHPERNWRHLAACCRLADLVTVTTPALAKRYGGHGRVRVLPNFVPARYLDVPSPENGRPVIGWPGSPRTHVGDLEVTGDAVRRVLASTDATFHAIGSPRTMDLLGVDGMVTDWVDLLNGYPEAVASLDVGMVPLADTAFNAAKSNLKMSELASLGVACVASPSPDNQALHALGVGLLASKPRQWEGLLRMLVTDPQRRIELAERGREVMRGRTIEANAWRWMEAWSDAVEHRRGRRAA